MNETAASSDAGPGLNQTQHDSILAEQNCDEYDVEMYYLFAWWTEGVIQGCNSTDILRTTLP